MKISTLIFGGLLAAAMPASALAQAPLVAGGPVETSVLRAGASVPVRTLTELTTKGKRLRVGERFNIEVSEPVSLNGHLVIPAGSPGMGEVTSVRNKGMWGKSGNIEVRLLYIRVGDRQIRLTGATNDKGVTGTAGVVGAVLLVPVVGFFTTGTSAVIPAGAIIPGFLDEDVPVSFAPGTAVQPPLPAAPAIASATAGAAVPAPASALTAPGDATAAPATH